MEISEIKSSLVNTYIQRFPDEAASILNTFSTDDILHYLTTQPNEIREDILQSLSPEAVGLVIEQMDDRTFLELFESVDSYSAAKFLS